MQQQIEARVGELVFLVVRMAFDTRFEVETNTFTGRMGMAVREKVEMIIDEAVEMLLEMDEVVAEVTGEHAMYDGEIAWV